MNYSIKTFNRFTPLTPDVHTPNEDDTIEIDVQNVTNNSITNNKNNTSETERSKNHTIFWMRKMADVSLTEFIPANKKIEASALYDDELLENIF